MVHVLILGGRSFKSSELNQWKEDIPELDRRLVISSHWRKGAGKPVEPGLAPITLNYLAPVQVPDSFVGAEGVPLVREAIKKTIEDLDPGLHQFLPIEIRGRQGNDHFESYYLMDVWRTQDTIIDERTDCKSAYRNYPERRDRMLLISSSDEVKVTVNEAKMDAINLWREDRYPGLLMYSDILHKNIMAKRLRFFANYKAFTINKI